MENNSKNFKLKPIDVYIKEIYELAEKTKEMETIKFPPDKKKKTTKKKNIKDNI